MPPPPKQDQIERAGVELTNARIRFSEIIDMFAGLAKANLELIEDLKRLIPGDSQPEVLLAEDKYYENNEFVSFQYLLGLMKKCNQTLKDGIKKLTNSE